MNTVLLADDAKLMQKMLADTIADIDGYELVETVENGEEAVEAYESIDPDVVVLDVEMPEMNGPPAAEKMGIRGESKLVFLSGDNLTAKGDEQVLQKPVEDGALEAAFDAA